MSKQSGTTGPWLEDFSRLTPGNSTVALNAPTSAVGRAVLQLAKVGWCRLSVSKPVLKPVRAYGSSA